MQRTFGLDVLACPRCVDRMALTALIEDPRVIRHLLGHPGLLAEVPPAWPARSPPLPRLRHDGDDEASRSAQALERSPGRRRYEPDIDVP